MIRYNDIIGLIAALLHKEYPARLCSNKIHGPN
jgi:hypothetical protein